MNCNASKIMLYNKLNDKITKKYQQTASEGIVNTTQLGDRNTMLKLENLAYSEARNSLYKNKKNGETVTVADKENDLKAKRNATSKGLFLLPVVGWIAYAFIYGIRNFKFKRFRENIITKTAKEHITKELLNNPCFLDNSSKFYKNLEKNDRRFYKKCINTAFQEIASGKYDKELEKLSSNMEKINQVNGGDLLANELVNSIFGINVQDAAKFFQKNQNVYHNLDFLTNKKFITIDTNQSGQTYSPTAIANNTNTGVGITPN